LRILPALALYPNHLKRYPFALALGRWYFVETINLFGASDSATGDWCVAYNLSYGEVAERLKALPQLKGVWGS